MKRLLSELLCINIVSFLLVFFNCNSRLAYEKQIVDNIIKQAGATDLTFDDVAKVENGRVVELDDLYGNIKEITNELCELTALRILNLYGLGIEKLPDSIGKLQNLIILKLGENSIVSVPKSLSQLQSLRELYLYANELDTFPPEILSLCSLEILYLAENSISEIPSS